MEYSTLEIQKGLDELTEFHLHNKNFVSVEFTDKLEFIVRFRNLDKKIENAPEQIELNQAGTNSQIKVPVSHEVGPEVIPFVGDIEKHPPFIHNELINGEMGGDQCRNAKTMGYYGTITIYAGGINLDANGRCNKKCGTSPALMSNNHVIGRSDAGRKGEVIWTPFRKKTAKLECLIPFSCNSSTDVALAKVTNISGISKWRVRSIGLINNVRRPKIGESIQKHGARTGHTTGKVTGQGNIRVGGYLFRKVFSTTKGFSCPGDSGSAVIGTNKDLIGVLSWGEKIDCDKNPKGYFWTLINPGNLNAESEYSEINVEIDQS